MDVEIIEEEARDALQFDEEEASPPEVEVLSEESTNSGSDEAPAGKGTSTEAKSNDPKLLLVPAEKKNSSSTGSVVEWLDSDSEDWTDKDSMSGDEPGEVIEGSAAAKIVEKKTEKDDGKNEKKDSSQEDSTKTDKSSVENSPNSKQAGNKKNLANALLKAAKRHAMEKYFLEKAKLERRATINLSMYRQSRAVQSSPASDTKPKQELWTKTVKGKTTLPLAIIPIKNAPATTIVDKDKEAKSKQEETIAKLQHFTERSSELTVRKLGASNETKITRVTMQSNCRIRIPPATERPMVQIGPNTYTKSVANNRSEQPANFQILKNAPNDTSTRFQGPGTSINLVNNRIRVKRPMMYKPSEKVLIPAGGSKPDDSPNVKEIVSERTDKSESFTESLLRSEHIKEIPRLKKVPDKGYDTSHLETIPQGTIRVKSNAMLFDSPKVNENVFTTSAYNLEPPILERSSPSANREQSPEPTKYVIPQDMLMSSTEKAKVVERKPAQQTVNVASDFNFSDMFVMDLEPEDEKKAASSATATVSPLLRHKRKASIVLKNDDETEFDAKRTKPTQLPPPRPQENIDLIENLALYRVLVSSILKKRDMPPMDFSEDSTDYINTYKIYRN